MTVVYLSPSLFLQLVERKDPDQVAAQRRQEVIQREFRRYTQNWIGDPRNEQQTVQEVTEDWME
eukprot:4463190-Pyramimonas_sp.AAC.1